MHGVHFAPGAAPTREQAQALAEELLGDQGTRLAHVLTAGRIAAAVAEGLRESGSLTNEEAALLVVAATVHDIGYAPSVARTGFHPLDGAVHLRSLGWSPWLGRLVANHSCALVTAPDQLTPRVRTEFPPVPGLLPDSLTYSDMHSSPRGEVIAAEVRLADIAARHADPREAARAVQLRLALARVGDALLLAEGGGWIERAGGARVVRRRLRPDLRAG